MGVFTLGYHMRLYRFPREAWIKDKRGRASPEREASRDVIHTGQVPLHQKPSTQAGEHVIVFPNANDALNAPRYTQKVCPVWSASSLSSPPSTDSSCSLLRRATTRRQRSRPSRSITKVMSGHCSRTVARKTQHLRRWRCTA